MQFFKKIAILFLSFLITVIIVLYFYLYVNGPIIQAKSAILIDANSGEVVYKKNERTPIQSPTLTKLMTEYIVLEQLHDGKIQLDESVKISNEVFHTETSPLQITSEDNTTVRDLLHALLLTGNNRSALALAEHIAGNEDNFTTLMNEKAKQLKLSQQSPFLNSTGINNENNKQSITTAIDAAEITAQLIKDYPDVLNITKLTSYQFTFKDFQVFNTNKMIYSLDENIKFKGVDGLQTSFSTNGNYSFVGTAKQGDTRFISVVLDANQENTAFVETKKLLQYGFEPSSYSALQAFKDAVTSWTILLQFKNLIIQTIMIFFIITILMFLHIRQKKSEDFN
ncbi:MULTISPECIES: D-alanyl-D-alanine carboxypeptidase family protein [Bacillus cereus group]|uniref:D-alanyl-D-alanine carboxypeptidase n=1 Tax=Bacillus paramycoides TaxID=2026194 RepID=A0ABU6MXW7_9BACI|nr:MULTISPECIES: D-alanyl-D-alanine carboxypeptidase family protein [Bacillus cereus group]MED0973292.1 D-alanyl-D-alanine carboxypeptidase [Bacillus paramycoides]MED0982243.1 D-alanyl-D-alanine carboxypeptidase [Bacillus paramycoides]MED0987387.1 D-alanyl-D-alanine carboxypeptidase [Bacillus paramycoides]MED1107421.1 D-alanyl-D-alanine carboxypeptidase [Bacillus paramycoides]MED1560143.1 D-alanyl-D-alanine carboxypeptidase [Bacillus paramycoides]